MNKQAIDLLIKLLQVKLKRINENVLLEIIDHPFFSSPTIDRRDTTHVVGNFDGTSSSLFSFFFLSFLILLLFILLLLLFLLTLLWYRIIYNNVISIHLGEYTPSSFK